MKPTYKEIERQLSESRREFWAADATINNLEMKLADMAERVANEESKCAALAAENAAIKFYLRNGPVVRKGGEHVAAHQFSPETPATDAFLAEVRAQGVEMAMEHMRSSGSLTFGDCYISLNEFAAQLRQGAVQ